MSKKTVKSMSGDGQNIRKHTDLENATKQDVLVTWTDTKNEFSQIRSFGDLHMALINSCTMCCLCCIIVPVIPITMIIVGIISISSCPLQPFLPYFLIVTGVINYVFALLSWSNRKSGTTDKGAAPIIVNRSKPGEVRWAFDCCFHVFLMLWFLAGLTCAFQAFPNVKYGDKDAHCNQACILLSFWYCLVTLITTIISVLAFCLLVAFASGIQAANESAESGEVLQVVVKPPNP